MTEVRHLPVAISVEQIATAWARQDAAPHGSAVIVDHEIGGRQRRGIPWQVPSPDALSCAVIVRPDLRPEAEDALWVVALVAAHTATGVRPGWPDLLFTEAGIQVGAVGLDVQLGAGTVLSAVLSLRIDAAAIGEPLEHRRPMADRFVAEVLRCTAMLEGQRPDLLEEYAVASRLIGRRVRARLLPRGEARGRAVAVDPMGTLVLESPTGMLERLSPVSVLRVDPA